MTSNPIKVKPIFLLFIIGFLVAGFIGLILLSKHQSSRYLEAGHNMEIDTTFISGDEGFGALRGAVFYKENYFVSSAAKLIENPCNYQDWKSDGPIIDFNSRPHVYSLDDLDLPYALFKKPDNDTLHVFKDGCELVFLLD